MDGCWDWVGVSEGRSDSFCGNLGHFLGFDEKVTHDGCLLTVTVYLLEDAVGLHTKDIASMSVSIHEDNAGALILAQTLPPQCTHRSKYYTIKTVWLCEEIQKRKIKLLKIDTKEQLGDIFTKGLHRPQFEYLRQKLMGW